MPLACPYERGLTGNHRQTGQVRLNAYRDSPGRKRLLAAPLQGGSLGLDSHRLHSVGASVARHVALHELCGSTGGGELRCRASMSTVIVSGTRGVLRMREPGLLAAGIRGSRPGRRPTSGRPSGLTQDPIRANTTEIYPISSPGRGELQSAYRLELSTRAVKGSFLLRRLISSSGPMVAKSGTSVMSPKRRASVTRMKSSLPAWLCT